MTAFSDAIVSTELPVSTADRPATDSDQSWQQTLSQVIRDPVELFQRLELDPALLADAYQACQDFPLRVPQPYLDRIEKGNPHDPLLKQILPLGAELNQAPGFTLDPLEEVASNPAPGLIHKYHGRVLLVASGGCAINCRYCFRRHFPYSDNNPSRQQWQQALDYIRRDSSIQEVILSGGDPLVASDRWLAELAQSLADVPHVTTLRIHSRLPVVIPQRINPQSLGWMQQPKLQTLMVIHSNHPNEIDQQVGEALLALKQAGVTVLNQSVLLATINDNAATLSALSQRLFEFGVLPYYLHLLDKVQGAAHFEVSEDRARQLVHQLLQQLPGYLVPKLVREEAGAGSKSPINLS